MIYSIPFGKDTIQADLPENRVLYYAEPVKPTIPQDVDVLIESALDNPYGTRRLEEIIQRDSKVLIISDDITRPTPKRLLIKHILKRLEKKDIADENITICLAPGTHRPMTNEELEETFGKDLLDRFSFLNINYEDTDRLIYIGDTPSGIPIHIYKEATEVDFILGIGNIVPHVSAGWGGGAKIVQPGICGEKTTEATHVIAALNQNVMEVCGNADNQCRHEMESVAKKVGLRFIVNTVMDENHNILGVFCGDFIEAHKAGVKLAREVLCPTIPQKADIVIASANPCNTDFWQGDKPFVFAQYGLKDGGTLIFLLSGEEGLSGDAPQHDYVLRHYCTLSEEKVREDVNNGVIKDLIGIDAPIHLDQVRKRGINTLLVSSHYSQEDTEALGFESCTSVYDALEKAENKLGKDATIGIIPYCGETLVQVKAE